VIWITRTIACDNTSVGVILRRGDGGVLTFHRTRPPWGVAAVAGHVDGHGGVAAAARAETLEEAGLTVTALTELARAWRPNSCPRPPGRRGVGHQWTIFLATASGTPRPSPDETRGMRWRSGAELQRLADLTAACAADDPARGASAAMPGLTPVWVRFFVTAGLITVPPAQLERVEALLTVPDPAANRDCGTGPRPPAPPASPAG
jgi:8-oxo-dGTP pyrophosphatase MutT (NUDIX family)